MPKKGEPRLDTCWRKSRIAARILLREEAGKLTPRDVALGRKLSAEKGVTPRLIQQAIYGLRAENINWNCPAGKQLDRLASLLPKQPRLDITVFGSAPLQLFLNPDFLSQDIDLYAPEENWDYLAEFVESKDLGKEKATFYIQVCDPRAFRSTVDWPSRAVEVERNGHLFRLVHPWDVLVSKLQRLEEKDLEAFKLVIAKTGHPTEEEFTKHLQKAVDLYRPKFDEETARGDMMLNTRELWKILWNKEIDVRAAIIRPALERARHDYEPPNPNLKTRLANLKLPPK